MTFTLGEMRLNSGQKSLESDFYHMDRAEDQAAGIIAGWRYYCDTSA